MIFADKIIQLRKKYNWSQEELAEKVNVSRQSVSKWEGAQSTPDLKKIIQLSEVFGVSTDYLLKDEIEEIEETEYIEGRESITPLRRVSLAEAKEFLALRHQAAGRIAFATFLCIISPICLLLLGGASEVPAYGVSENVAAGVGLVTLLVLVAIAVTVFILCGAKSAAYEFLEKEYFETEYGVSGMVQEAKKKYQPTYTLYNIVGTCLCILAAVPLFIGGAIFETDMPMVVMVCLTLFIASIGVFFFIIAGVHGESFNKLLQEGDYTKERKKKQRIAGAISTIYWLTIVAIYLGYSFYTENWDTSWIIWAVAGVLFAAIITAYNAFSGKEE